MRTLVILCVVRRAIKRDEDEEYCITFLKDEMMAFMDDNRWMDGWMMLGVPHYQHWPLEVTIKRAYMITLPYNVCTSTPIMKLEVAIFVICDCRLDVASPKVDPTVKYVHGLGSTFNKTNGS